jgi:hypothetical protein
MEGFKKKFPKLESLTLSLKELTGQAVVKSFLSNDSSTFGQFKEFSIKFSELRAQEEEDLNRQQGYLSYMSKKFPNVAHPRIKICYEFSNAAIEREGSFRPQVRWCNFKDEEEDVKRRKLLVY